MLVNHSPMTSIWPVSEATGRVALIDQRLLPHRLEIMEIQTLESMAVAIEDMAVRGAPLIGVSAAWGVAIGAYEILRAGSVDWMGLLQKGIARLRKTRPTAVNLFWALDRQQKELEDCTSHKDACERLWASAQSIQVEDIQCCKRIGANGISLIQEIYQKKIAQGIQNPVVNILTHCNAGWLACVDHGTATSPMYAAFDAGIPIHVWVDETRPRNQGAKLTAWELGQHGIAHTLIPDNAGGHLMQHGMVDLVITGADRVTRNGDAANKIGTYLKALAAKDNKVPFYIAMPESTIDWNLMDGVKNIPIETRNDREVRFMDGLVEQGDVCEVLICPESTKAVNYGFDVTPARFISGFITEAGICKADEDSLRKLYGRWSH